MPKPDREWLTVVELVDRWKENGISLGDIDSYFLTNKLRPSVFLPLSKLIECEEHHYNDEFVVEKYDPIYDGGLYHICGYKNIKWQITDQGQRSEDLCSDFIQFRKTYGDTYYILDASNNLTIIKPEIVVTKEDIERFEEEHGLAKVTTPSKTNKSKHKFEHGQKEYDDMCIVIHALKQVILGKSKFVDGGNPSIKDQADLISRFSHAGRALSKSHLDHLFPLVARIAEDPDE